MCNVIDGCKSRQGFLDTSGGKFVSAVGIPVEYRPRVENKEVRTKEEVVFVNKQRPPLQSSQLEVFKIR